MSKLGEMNFLLRNGHFDLVISRHFEVNLALAKIFPFHMKKPELKYSGFRVSYVLS